MQISYQNIDESLNSLDKIYAISGDEPLFTQETKEKIRKKENHKEKKRPRSPTAVSAQVPARAGAPGRALRPQGGQRHVRTAAQGR